MIRAMLTAEDIGMNTTAHGIRTTATKDVTDITIQQSEMLLKEQLMQ